MAPPAKARAKAKASARPRAAGAKDGARDRTRVRTHGPTPRTRLDLDARRAQLLALGLEHFGTRAYDDVSIDAIAEAAGISKGLLYHYFPTKRAFYAATVREAASELLASTEAAATRSKDGAPLERLHAALDAYLDFVATHARAFSTLMRSGVGVDEEIARIVDETRGAFVGKLTDELAEPLRSAVRGESRESLLLRVALRGWIGMVEAASLAWLDALEAPALGTAPAPGRGDVRDVLVRALLGLLAPR